MESDVCDVQSLNIEPLLHCRVVQHRFQNNARPNSPAERNRIIPVIPVISCARCHAGARPRVPDAEDGRCCSGSH
jgi:hypothetical protein